MMTYKILLACYLLVSSIALMMFLYRKFLQFLSPKKGYMIALFFLAVILTFDVSFYAFASFKIKEWQAQERRNPQPVLRLYAAE
jgi:DNA phosphorothioation-dependent restriction protein DptG